MKGPGDSAISNGRSDSLYVRVSLTNADYEPFPTVVSPKATVSLCKPCRQRRRNIVIEQAHIWQDGFTIDDAAHPMFPTPFLDSSD